MESFVTAIVDFLGPTVDYFAVAGFFILSFVAYSFLKDIFRGATILLLGRVLGLSANLRKAGEWAVITGSTDGIGKAYAKQLAARGLNVVLISRSLEKLSAVAEEIKSMHNVEVKTVAVDFSESIQIYDEVEMKLNGLNIGVLVNNVGMSYDYPEFLAEIPDMQKFLYKLINVNVTSMTMMTAIVLPQMLKNKGGVIINMSSASALKPCPLLTAYSATKAYVDMFSQGLQAEYECRGLTIQCLLPFYVTTKMSKMKKSSLTTPTPEAYVKEALASVGLSSRTCGYYVHNIIGWLIESIPQALVTWQLKAVHMALRKRALKRFVR